MVNRNLIRLKVVQIVYAYYIKGENNIEKAEEELDASMANAYDLYHVLLGLIVAITHEAQKYTEIETARALREGREKPSEKFANNRLALQLENNDMLVDYLDKKKLSWVNFPDVVNKLYNIIVQSTIYADYLNEEDNYENDKEFWRKVYKRILAHSEDIDEALESVCLYWNDDKEIVDTFVIKTIKRFEATSDDKKELLPEFDDDDDIVFAHQLLRTAILKDKEYQKYVSDASKNWDFNRLAYMDVILMQIALAELFTFQSIPAQVTINEYVELAKLYSTPQSGAYINGMLDSITRKLISDGVIKKQLDNKK